MTIAIAIMDGKQLPHINDMINRAVESEKATLPTVKIKSAHISEGEIRKKVLRALAEIIGNNSHKYPIGNPDVAINELKKAGLSHKSAKATVINNLVGSYKFKEAERLSKKDKKLQLKIRMGQLSKLILEFIQEEPSDKDKENFKIIQEIVETADFSLSRVKLGNYRGRIITLADIWRIEKDKQKESKKEIR